jgi:lipopolysaccharide transport system permease protein
MMQKANHAKPSLVAMTRDFLRATIVNAGLVREMVMRELRAGHAGHGLGSVWVYVQPLVVVGTFMLIFGVVIGSRIAITSSFPGDYTSYILIGMVPWQLMSNSLGRAPHAFSANASLVKQVVFPIEILPVANVIACFVMYLPAIALMVAYKLFIGGGITWLALALPAALGLHALMALGITLFLAIATPFLRDLREVVTMYMAISMYFTPAIYLPDWVPRLVRPVLYLNPFSYVVWVYQDTLFYGEIRHAFAWVVFALLAFGLFLGGIAVFRRVKPLLGNVL